jgi:hypothetical protein
MKELLQDRVGVNQLKEAEVQGEEASRVPMLYDITIFSYDRVRLEMGFGLVIGFTGHLVQVTIALSLFNALYNYNMH